MNNLDIQMDRDNHAQKVPSSPLSSVPSSDGFSFPVPDVDLATTDDEETIATDNADEDTNGDDDDDDVPDVPPAKRTKGCLSSIAVPASVKAAIAKASGGKCWLCDLYAVHVAHVIAKSDKILFEEYRRSGLLHLDSLHNMQNLMHLCGGCHSCFDARVPVWAFLPTNLSDFIAGEIAFQHARASAATHGIALPRPDPCGGRIANLLYGRYMIRAGYIATHAFVAQPTKCWLGNPLTAILRSASILAGVQRLDPFTQGGLPDAVARDFHHLLYLYGKPAPLVASSPMAVMPDPLDCTAPDSDAQPQLQPPPPPPPPQPQPQPQPRRHGKQAGPGRNRQTTPTGGRKQRIHDWVLGPTMTSNMLIEWRLAGIENARR